MMLWQVAGRSMLQAMLVPYIATAEQQTIRQ
jgi:hypothetical protein